MSADRSRTGKTHASQPQYFGNDVSCMNVIAVYEHMKRKVPERALEVFENLPPRYAEIEHPEIVLTDENNWVSSDLIVQMFINAKKILGDPEAPYHIGFESITHLNFGYWQRLFIKSFGSPGGILKRLNHVNSQLNNTKVVEPIYVSPGRAVVRLHWKENKPLSADICRYNRGVYAAVPTMFDRPPATIAEPFCQFEGDPYCQFNITFHIGRQGIKRFFGMFGTTKAQLLSALEEIENGKLILKSKYDEVATLNMELNDKLEKLKAINTASNLLVSRENTDEILATTTSIIANIMQFDRAIIMMVNEDRTKLEYRYALGATDQEINEYLDGYEIPLDRENILARVAKSGRPTVIRDAEDQGLRMGNIILSNFDVSSFVMCPLMATEGMIGILAADRHKSGREIARRDIDDLTIFANTIAETLHKAQLKEQVESSYLDTVRALVRAIEEKDSYTRGHSERVAELSVLLGKELGMKERELEYLRLACLLHDVGKIGVSEAIVKSPKALTVGERKVINQHPLKGAEIARPISFLKDYMYIIRSHHERYDGTGYPDGLRGNDIPLGARITGVADAYDAITSTRSYRKGEPPEEAARRIFAGSGQQFAPEVVEAFRAIYERGDLKDIFDHARSQYPFN